jgi:hypothetical protein
MIYFLLKEISFLLSLPPERPQNVPQRQHQTMESGLVVFSCLVSETCFIRKLTCSLILRLMDALYILSVESVLSWSVLAGRNGRRDGK